MDVRFSYFYSKILALLNLEKLGIEFAGRWLVRDANYQFLPGERVGLIGRNGSGKSSLLKVIHGDLLPSQGKVNRSGNLSIGYYHQELLSFQTDKSIFEVAREAFAPMLKLKDDIEHLLQKMEAGHTDETLITQLDEKQSSFEAKGGTQMDANVHAVLSGLGFPPESHSEPYQIFSGGWRMRVLLARILLKQPDILLLDEPTNHLDLPSIQWLESYLKSYKGSCILVSHDRHFLDRLADKILEISLKQLNIYAGNYQYYLKEKESRLDLQRRAYENQQKHIAEQEKFINRFRAKATKARQVQSKIKQLEKLPEIEAPEEESFDLKIRFEVQQTSGKEVLSLKNISKAYGENRILQQAEGLIMRGDKVALIGANGKGKSTLLRIIANSEEFTGERKTGHNVALSLFAQHQLEVLKLQNTILEEVQREATDKSETELRNILGSFMFSGDDIYKPIKVLSGGEKSRVALVKTLLSKGNFLLLDEPTNHLDIQSIQILSEALNAYEGTYILVSHDQYFLQSIANKIWYIEDQQIKEYIGSFNEFQSWYNQQLELREGEQMAKENPLNTESTKPGDKDFKEQKKIKNRIKKLQRTQEDIEIKIEELESMIHELQAQMASTAVATDFNQLSLVQNELKEKEAALEEAQASWEKILMELEELGEW